jgi:uncharacterized membrane protein YphA (DoxX/SURF4 family)
MKILQNSLRFILGLTFLFSGISKLISITDFIEVVQRITSFPWMISIVMAFTICAIETVLAILVIIKMYLKFATLGILLITLIFTIYQIFIVANGETNECFCFGAIVDEYIGMVSLTRNILIMVISWTLMKSISLEEQTERVQ